MTSSRTSVVATFLAGVTLLIPAYLGQFLGVPTVLCPLPLVTTLPAFVMSTWRLESVAVVVPVLIFWAWHLGLFRGAAKIPRRSYILLASVTVLSIVDFVAESKLGLRYRGAEYIRVVCLVNIGWAAFLTIAFRRAWTGGPSFRTNLVLHWMLFAWLAWYAFPYMGELP